MAVWTIQTMERSLPDGGVTTAHWHAAESETVGDVEYISYRYGTCSFTPDPDAEDFIPYDDLTEATVLDWVYAHQGIDKDALETALAADIAEQKTPTKSDGVPW